MIKLVFSLRRREDMTREEFQRYWREQHAPLVERHAKTLAIRRYVQTHAQDTELDWVVYNVSTRCRKVRENEAVTDNARKGTGPQPDCVQCILGRGVPSFV